MTSVVVDPLEEGFEAITWTCTFTGEECLEATGDESWSGLTLFDDSTTELTTTATVPAALSAFLTEEPVPLITHWTLACLPGTCAIFDDVRADSTEALRADLADPYAWMADLSFEGVSLSLRTVSLSTRSEGERSANPTVSCTPRAAS